MPLSPGAQKVQDALAALGLPHEIVELARPARTAVEAAAAVGCGVGQIAKSLVFRGAQSGRPILVIASGANRVNEHTVAALVAEPIEKADADFVRERTGFAIGGVPPLAHTHPVEPLIDEDLVAHAEIWAAAGHPNTVFKVSPGDLLTMTRGRVVRIT
ncbi:MAG TPA: YbaK/EbsC family protein [Methylomirabilota bacterium]|jgi:prolyl-tRNA editing enzyme YbaK/EbsC (Cys-tRNA(Pro) deacylase)